MRLNKILISFLILTCSWFMVTNVVAQSQATQGDPVALLRYIADNMIAGLKSNKATLKNKPQVVYNLAYRYVVPYADLTEMSRRVLPPQVWNNATPAQRVQFQKEFTTLLIRTYASALAAYQDQTIQFYPPRGDYQMAKSVEVNSQITGGSGDPIRVTYRLVRVGSVWRLYDMSVEGISLIDSFRSQFADMISQGNMAQLLDRMSGHNRR